ncbi:MAG: hypothetical protein B6I23_03450 [Rickettsiaceae bacterium 4572_127]|nr:MAG: hypothetical protein B6I23_03450 [Rickettsiaceae bacterium 4572_127]
MKILIKEKLEILSEINKRNMDRLVHNLPLLNTKKEFDKILDALIRKKRKTLLQPIIARFRERRKPTKYRGSKWMHLMALDLFEKNKAIRFMKIFKKKAY